MDGLEPVAGIRQGARHDHAHGVIEVCLLHLLVDIDLLNQTNFHSQLQTPDNLECLC